MSSLGADGAETANKQMEKGMGLEPDRTVLMNLGIDIQAHGHKSLANSLYRVWRTYTYVGDSFKH